MRNSILLRLCRAYPFLSGYGRIANSTYFRDRIDRDFPDEITGTLRNGMRFTSPGRDFVGRAAYLFGDLDPKISLISSKIVREGDVVVDIGAHIGLFTLQASSAVGETGKVYAVEPQTDLFTRLSRSLAENKISNVTVFPFALGDSNQISKLHVPQGNSGAASLISKGANSVSKPVVVLNSGEFFRDLPIDHIRLIKMDVEGAEPAVVRGALPFLRERKPDAIIFEARPGHGSEERLVVEMLSGLGYTCLAIKPSARSIRLGHRRQGTRFDGVHDMIALAPGKVGHDLLDTILLG